MLPLPTYGIEREADKKNVIFNNEVKSGLVLITNFLSIPDKFSI